jgi:hypothetical protein
MSQSPKSSGDMFFSFSIRQKIRGFLPFCAKLIPQEIGGRSN